MAGQDAVDGTPFGRYRLIEMIGAGGMGEVWRAYDTAANNREVAIKLLPPNLANDTSVISSAFEGRIDLVSGCRRDTEFGRDRVDRLLRDVRFTRPSGVKYGPT